MINSMGPGNGQGHDAKRGDVLERISQQYGKPEEKQRDPVKKLGKDEFFKIMITQIQHQDPLKPAQNEQMAAQMAQFSALEQMVNMNQNLDKLTAAQQPLHNLGATNLIGKYVTADSSRMLHKEGKSTNLSFDLPNDASKVHINILNERGETIQEIEKTNLKKGENKLEWDGKRSNNLAAASGTYMMQISAVDDKGRTMPVTTAKTELVRGVAFEGRETVLIVGELAKPQRMLLSNVSKIVDTRDKPSAFGVNGPGGMQIEGLENLINGQNGQNGAPVPPRPPEEEPTRLDPEQMNAGKFSPFDAAAMRKAMQEEKPAIQPRLSNEDIRELIKNGPELGMNPAAEAVKQGIALPGAAETSDANPAAQRFASGANSAVGNAMPSSEDGSVAGRLSE